MSTAPTKEINRERYREIILRDIAGLPGAVDTRLSKALFAAARADESSLKGVGRTFLGEAFELPGFVLAACLGEEPLTYYCFNLLFHRLWNKDGLNDHIEEAECLEAARRLVKLYQRQHALPTPVGREFAYPWVHNSEEDEF